MSEARSSPGNAAAGPLGPIALTLSGGGYRAAAFHLGTLRTLHEAQMLDSVDLLSTVSGGTIVGASYALSQTRHESFERFYDDFLTRLKTQRPVHRASQLLIREHNSLPRRTLIAAQAAALNEQYFGNATFGEFFETPIHIGEIIFNATDFRCGLPFRFQKSRNPRARIGNGKHWMPKEIAVQMRLADVVAASSCFPGGFEPIGFPHDFVWGDRESVLKTLAEDSGESTFVEPLPLMDGGVADNQGLGSLRVALDRREREDHPPIGLVLISDADAPSDAPLIRHVREPRAGWVSVSNVILGGRVLLVVALIAAGLLGRRLGQMILTRTLPDWWTFVESTFSFAVLLLAVVVLSVGLRWLKHSVFRQIPERSGLDVVGTLGMLSPSWLGDLLCMRAESLFAMSNNVFMKNVRDLRYREMYENEKLRDRVVANLIYELPKRGLEPNRDRDTDNRLQLSDAMIQVAIRAGEMPTTLWFEDNLQSDAVVLCGRFTACFNLIDYVQKRIEQLADRQDQVNDAENVNELARLESRLMEVWRELETEVTRFPVQ
ncbi:MAG: patatin-like phospholipase family protein [Planctomycetaceae bacterium]|nr:patatin-like phospholipase family protein [Planctomycetales bacterium]MCB9923488.1 patatin-like phospholipase family protein [Planctomycetaceae bacterium]